MGQPILPAPGATPPAGAQPSNATAMDDLEQGEFRPTWFDGGSTGITYSPQVGTYTKVGRRIEPRGDNA